MRLTYREKIFLNHVKSECRDYNVRFYIGKGFYVRGDFGTCSGYFIDEKSLGYDGTLSFATKRLKSVWFPVLVHEYGHMLQWIEKFPLFVNDIISNGKSAYVLFEDWLCKRIELDPEIIDEAVACVIAVEKDCDKRAVELIKKFQLPIDIDIYIKRANIYHYSYHVLKETRNWGMIKPNIYRSHKILSLMPSHFRCDTAKTISNEKYDAIYDFYANIR